MFGLFFQKNMTLLQRLSYFEDMLKKFLCGDVNN